jgi:peptidoglycan/LPS O-acetylase OafA/YrhL
MRRYIALDGLRGFAAFAVVLYHFRVFVFPGAFGFARHGFYAVDLFLIISGFIIATNYAGRIRAQADATDFMLRRVFRVWPLHVAVLAATCVEHGVRSTAYGLPFFDVLHRPESLPTNVLLIHSWGIFGGHTGWNLPSWSISVELLAYIVFAVIVLKLRPTRWDWLMVALAGLVAYAAILIARGTMDAADGIGVIRGLAGFSIGGAISILRPSAIMTRLQVPVAAATLAVLVFLDEPWTGLALPLFAALIMSLRDERGAVARLLGTRPMQVLGLLSYSIYMIHASLMLSLKAWLGGLPGSMAEIQMLGLAFACAVVVLSLPTYFLIEEPGRRFGRWLSVRPVRLKPC